MKLRLRELRQRAVLSQAELAERAGVSESTIKLIERGAVSPHPRTVRKLAETLGVETSELIEEYELTRVA